MQKGILYYITGLSGAGKTTIGTRLYEELRKKQDNVVILDGDVLKNIVADSYDYGIADRKSRAMKYARLCNALVEQGITVVCCTISMFDEVRDWNRSHNERYVEVFLDVPMETLKKRDQKGMYSGQLSGRVTNLVGVDLQVEFPKNPDIIIKNDDKVSISESVKKILGFIV